MGVGAAMVAGSSPCMSCCQYFVNPRVMDPTSKLHPAFCSVLYSGGCGAMLDLRHTTSKLSKATAHPSRAFCRGCCKVQSFCLESPQILDDVDSSSSGAFCCEAF